MKKFTITLIALVVIFTTVLAANSSFGQSQTGSIQLNIFYTNGDRVDNNGLVLKIYQDSNTTVYRTIQPNSYPTIIDSLPINHKYTIYTFRDSMFAGSDYIDLKDSFEKIDTNIPLDGGIRFNVFYNDGVTPLSNATVVVKSDDGITWAKGNTDEQGSAKRFWLQSSIRDGDYYDASFSIGPVNFTYPTHIIINPGSSRDLQIITPWPSIVDSLITVSVYKSPTEKVKTEDGNYYVFLSDINGNHIADSKVDSHGQATFSKLKVRYYDIHVIKKTPGQPDTEVALDTLLLTGDKTQIPIYIQNTNIPVPVTIQNGTVQYLEKGTTTTIPPVSIIGRPQDSCNCVIFRLDDVQDSFVRSSDLAIMNLFTLKHKDLTLGIVANYTGKDQTIVDTIKQGIRKNIFFPAIHGYDHIDYTTLAAFDQYQSLDMANQKLNKLFGNTSDLFIPPYNHFNNGTLDGLKKIGVKIMSAGSLKDPQIYHFSKDHKSLDSTQIYHMSQGSDNPLQRAAEINYFATTDLKDILHDIKFNLANSGYAVITLHPQDIAVKDSSGHLTNKNNSLNQTQIQHLAQLIDRLDADGIAMTNFYDVAGLPQRNFPVSANSSLTYQDPLVTNVFTLGKGSAGVAVNPITNMIYVTNSKSNSVSVINGSLNAVYDAIGVGDIPVGISVNPKTNMVYVVNSGSGTVSVIDGSTNTLSDKLAIESIAYGVAVNPVLNMVYFIDPYVPAVDFVDGNTNKISSTVKVEGNPQRIAVNSATNMIYLTNSKSDSITVIDGSTRAVANTIHAGNGTMPLAIAVNSATNMIYVTNSKSDSITVIDGSTRAVANTIHVGNGDTHLTISVNPSTNMIYVTNSKSDSITVIDGSTKTIMNTIHVGSGNFPSGITSNDLTNMLYVSNVNSGTISVIGNHFDSSSKATVPEFSLMTLMIFSISVSILIFLTRFKMMNLTR